jgi:hypothetical protein
MAWCDYSDNIFYRSHVTFPANAEIFPEGIVILSDRHLLSGLASSPHRAYKPEGKLYEPEADWIKNAVNSVSGENFFIIESFWQSFR